MLQGRAGEKVYGREEGENSQRYLEGSRLNKASRMSWAVSRRERVVGRVRARNRREGDRESTWEPREPREKKNQEDL